MAIDLLPLPLPASADASNFQNFGREVKGLHPGKLTPEELQEVQKALYQVRLSLICQICYLYPSTHSTTSSSFVTWS